MFNVTTQQMQQIKASLSENTAVQQVLFDTIGFTPADDPWRTILLSGNA